MGSQGKQYIGGITMTKEQAKKELYYLSAGTICTLTGKRLYTEIDEILGNWMDKVDEVDVSECKNWVEVYNLVK